MSAPKTLISLVSLSLLAATLTGCDQLGIETPDKVAARMEAEGKAVGGACRHAGRALEDCYEMNRRASKASVYAGWRDMDGYMRENNIAVVKPSMAEDEATPKVGSSAKPEVKNEAQADEATHKPAETVAAKPAGDKAASAALHGENSARPAIKTS